MTRPPEGPPAGHPPPTPVPDAGVADGVVEGVAEGVVDEAVRRAVDEVVDQAVDEAVDEVVRRAVAVLRAGGLVALPTETVYGLGADAGNPAAVAKIFAAKGRPTGHPLIVHLASADAVADGWIGAIPSSFAALAAAFWPGPLTMIVPRGPRVLDAVTGGRATVGLRVPDHALTLAVLAAFGGGVAAPSANRFGRVSPTSADHVRAELGDAVDLVLDGGTASVGIESTIVDLTSVPDGVEVLRLGAVTAADLRRVLGSAIELVVPGANGGQGDDSEPGEGGGARAPGMLAAHYAPDAEVRVIEPPDAVVAAARAAVAAGRRVGVLAPSIVPGLERFDVLELEPAGGAEHYATVLYDRLRQADRLDVDLLLVVPPDDPAGDPLDIGSPGLAAAIRDRLRRAATGSARA